MIKDIRVKPVSTSKNKDSIEVELKTDKKIFKASVPSGTSTGKYEAVEFSPEKCKKILEKIKPNFIGLEENWKQIDIIFKKIDGTDNFSKIGGNLALGISISTARAETDNQLWKLGGIKKLPLPLCNVVGGGKHGGKTDFQEFLLFSHKTKMISDVYKEIGIELKNKKKHLGKNLEGAFITKLDDIKTLDFLSEFAEDWNLKIGIDCAASEFWDKKYIYKTLGKKLTSDQQIDFLIELIKQYKIFYLEDPFHEEDFESFSILTKEIGKKCLIVGDDLYATNPERLKIGLKIKAGNGIIIKPNQVGTLTDTFRTVQLAKNMKIIPSHRSGETKDNWLADLAVVWNAPMIKIGFSAWDRPKFDRLSYLSKI